MKQRYHTTTTIVHTSWPLILGYRQYLVGPLAKDRPTWIILLDKFLLPTRMWFTVCFPWLTTRSPSTVIFPVADRPTWITLDEFLLPTRVWFAMCFPWFTIRSPSTSRIPATSTLKRRIVNIGFSSRTVILVVLLPYFLFKIIFRSLHKFNPYSAYKFKTTT